MSAVADPPADVLTSQPRREKLYASRRGALRLVMQAEYHILGPQGQKTGQTTGGVRIEFLGGQLRVPLEGNVTTAQGRKFPAAELITWLDQHPMNGDRHEGFFEIAEAAPPVSEEEFERISEAAMLGNVELLRQILASEEAGWARPAITNVVRKRLGQLEEYLAEVAAQQEAEAAAKPAPKAKAAAKAAAKGSA